MTKKKTTTRRSTSTSRKRTTKPKSTRGGTSSRRSKTRKRTPSRARKKTSRDIRLNLQQKALLGGIGIVFVTAVLVLSLLSPNQGQLTSALSDLMWRAFGWGGVLVPIMTGAVGLYLVMWGMEQQPELPGYRLFGLVMFFLAFESFATLVLLMGNNGYADVWLIAQAKTGGGYLGGLLTFALIQAIGNLGAIFTLVVMGLVATVLISGITRADLGQFLSSASSWRPQTNPLPGRDIAINPGRTAPTARKTAVQPPLAPNLTPETEDESEPESTATAKPKRTRRARRKTPEKPTPSEDDQPTVATPVFLGDMSRGGHNWELPVMAELLESGTDQDVNSATIRDQVEIIEHTLDSFGAPATVVEINQGPAITQFGVEPMFIEMRSGKRTKVKVGKIAGLADDLALALAAQSIRIQAPVPGKGYVGIEVPNVKKALVSLRDVMESQAFRKIKSPLGVGLGQNVAGQAICTDLASLPHLLIAGTTGSGKSVMVNGIIAGLLLQNTPDDLKLVMVDPKRVELTGYNGIPHLAAPVVVEMDRVIGTLQWAMREMDNRYKMFADLGARNIIDYNKKAKGKKTDKLPYIVIVIDELADLMMLSPEETERGITRLAQMARATGIHMVIATQRPSVDVVTGLIKANFPARIAFAVASSTDSRVILDSTGAERLLGQGDMLFQSPDAAAPLRLQGCFVSPGELDKLINYWQKARRFNLVPAQESVMPRSEVPTPAKPEQAAPKKEIASSPTSKPTKKRKSTKPASPPAKEQPVADTPEPPAPPPTSSSLAEADDAPTRPITTAPKPATDDQKPVTTPQQPLWEELQKVEEQAKYEDEMMPEAIALVRQLRKASTSLLQRRFRIGYTRAARMIDAMEDEGIIGPPTGTSKAREVLLPPENEETESQEENDT